MQIELERNTSDDRKTIPYYVHIELAPLAAPIHGTKFRIPIFLHWIRGQNGYVAELCSYYMEARSPQGILNQVRKVAPSLLNFNRMPTYLFIARHARKVYPVYTKGNEVIAITTPGGPVVRHVELAVVRQRVTAFLNKSKALGQPGQADKLHVRGVHQETLGLIRPIYYLKKRPQSDNDQEFWAPVFPSSSHAAIYAYAVNERREVEIDAGREVFRLRSLVAQALIGDKRLHDDLDLRVDRLLPKYWQKVQAHLERLSRALQFNNICLDLYQTQFGVMALEYRTDEDRYSFYLGLDEHDLCQRAGRDLMRRGYISSPAMVEIV
mgnify:CR=1 FL=1